MPPPNITGKLHMGHAMFATLQDILTRYHRMAGFNTLWLPGSDHAGLATQTKLDAEMISQGLDPNGPAFDDFAAQYRANIGGTIMTQLRRTGASCDWSRERFTLDDRYTRAVEAAFEKCREKDMLYREGNDWFLDMSGLAARLLNEIDAGKLTIEPAYATKTLRHFLENIEPWCISRQIRWGHRIPIEGETDVLDTWFSSALWPFAALGWPDQTEDLKTFYPAALIETADDILFFWCARMLMMGLLIMDRLPFETIFLHGIIRDKDGRKMSKSLDNGIDPIEMIDQYGCDGMRFALAADATPGQDMNLHPDKLQAGKATAHKLWSIARFCLPNIDETLPADEADREMLERSIAVKEKIGDQIERREFHLAAHALQRFLFDDLSSDYIANNHARLREGSAVLGEILRNTLIAAHPIMPFITEEIFSRFNDGMLINREWA